MSNASDDIVAEVEDEGDDVEVEQSGTKKVLKFNINKCVKFMKSNNSEWDSGTEPPNLNLFLDIYNVRKLVFIHSFIHSFNLLV